MKNKKCTLESLRQRILKVILCGILVTLATNGITAVFTSKRIVSISIPSPVAEATNDTDSTLSTGTVLVEPEVKPQPVGDIEIKLKEVFGEEWKIARAVMLAESGGNPNTIGDRHLAKPSVGLFQICQIWHPYTTEQLQDPEFNIKTAKAIRDSGGWERWTTYRNKSYLRFLN